MDADLQHPPEKLPELLAPARDAARRISSSARATSPGGSTGERVGRASPDQLAVATFLARPFAGRTTDPMSGFFALKRDDLRSAPAPHAAGLQDRPRADVQMPRAATSREVPIHFAERTPRRVEADAQAAVPLPRAPQPALRLHLPARLAGREVPDRAWSAQWALAAAASFSLACSGMKLAGPLRRRIRWRPAGWSTALFHSAMFGHSASFSQAAEARLARLRCHRRWPSGRRAR